MNQTISGFPRNLRWKQIFADYDLPANVDISRRSAIYAESNEVEN